VISQFYPLTCTTAAGAGAQCRVRRRDVPTTVSGDPRVAVAPCAAAVDSSDHPIVTPVPDPGLDRSPPASLG